MSIPSVVALSGDHLLAVLDGGDVQVVLTDSAGHPSGRLCGDPAALLHWHAVTHRLGDLGGSLVYLGRAQLGQQESGRVLSFSPDQVMIRGGRWRLHRAILTVGCPVDHSSGDHLAVVTDHLPGDDGLYGGLLAGGGDALLAVLGVDGVHDLVVFLVTECPRSLHLPRQALHLRHGVTPRLRRVVLTEHLSSSCHHHVIIMSSDKTEGEI